MSNYELLIQKYQEHLTQDGNSCVSLGIDKHLGELPDPSLAKMEEEVKEGKKLLEEIQNFPLEELNFDQKLDLELAVLSVQQGINENTRIMNGKLELIQKPFAGDEISGGMFLLFANDPRPAQKRLENITSRLEGVPTYISKLLSRLSTPVQRWVEMDIDQVEELPSFFSTLFNWAKEENYPEIERMERAIRAAEVSLKSYMDILKKMPTTDSFTLGHETAQEIIKLRGIDKTLEELQEMSRSFLMETNQTIDDCRKNLVQKYGLAKSTTTEELHQFLNKEFKVPIKDGNLESIIDRYLEEKDRIRTFIDKHDLFPIFEEQDMLIMRTPKFMEPSVPAGAMMSPPPFRDGIRKSMIYLTLSEELLDEHTELGIPNMMIHEGIPGHHLQLATGGKHESVVRKSFDASEHAEGWTTMLEDYMLDMDYMGDLTEECRFISKRDIARIGARVVIDLYFMTGDAQYLEVGIDADFSSNDPFENAGRLLKKVTGFTDARIQGELNWYSAERGYPLSYLSGNKMVWELKRSMIKSQKGKLEGIELDRVFHKIYLESGCMPVSYLKRIFQEKGLVE